MTDVVKIQKVFDPEHPKFYYELFGLSTEEKPTADVYGGSMFTEQDTAIVWSFNEVGIWYPIMNLGGGGS